MPESSSSLPLVVHVLHRLHYAGAEVLAAALARELREQFQFAFICLDDTGPLGEQLRSEGFDVACMNRQPGIDWAVAGRIHGVLQEWGRARKSKSKIILHAHQYTPFFYAAFSRGLLGSLRSDPPILFTEHGRHYPDVRKLKRVIANQFLLRQHDRATAVGNFVRDALIRNEGLPGSRIDVIYNGIDPRKFPVRTPDNTAARVQLQRALNLPEGTPMLLQVARFHPVKDHVTALRALAVLRQTMRAADEPEPVLLLAGDGEKRAELEALARELQIENHVRFLGVRNDISHLMQAADVFVLSSLSEGISVTLLEAMATGLPITATDVGGNREVVGPGDGGDALPASGLLSPRADPDALARNLQRLLLDKTLRESCSKAGPQRVHAKFTQQNMHGRYAELYRLMGK